MILLVSYDLKGHERPSAYKAVQEMIEQDSISCIRPLYSQWLVETNDTVEDWHKRMAAATDKNDNWFIVRVGKGRQGWLSKSVWVWLNSRTL